MKRLKGLFQEKIILSFVMFLLLCVVLFSATTAWYSANNTAVMSGMEIGAGGIGGLKVAIEPGGPDIMMLPEVNEDGIPVIPVKLTDLNNVKEQMIAPGSYGPMTFYITSLGETVTGYSIKVRLSYREEEEAGDKTDREDGESFPIRWNIIRLRMRRMALRLRENWSLIRRSRPRFIGSGIMNIAIYRAMKICRRKSCRRKSGNMTRKIRCLGII